MAKRASYPSIADAFREIMIDGEQFSTFDYLMRLERLTEEKPHEWLNEAKLVLARLIAHGNLIASTSGTTGPPKKLTIIKRDLVMSARLTGETFSLEPGDRVLHCLPCQYVAGKLMLVRAMALGLDLHLIDPRGSVLKNLNVNDRFRFAAMVPVQLHRALQEDKARVERQFDTILLGGGPVNEALIEDLRALNVNVVLSYGSTETVTHVALRQLNGPQAQDHFAAIGQCHFARDPRGCMVVYTPHLTTKQHVTNDLVELIDDTKFRWLGRWDHVILSGGKKIHPEQLEAKTASLIPYPHYFTAIADPALGQAVMLVLETERAQEEVVPEVMEKLMSALHPHEWPRRVQALRRIQRTHSGKIIRSEHASSTHNPPS